MNDRRKAGQATKNPRQWRGFSHALGRLPWFAPFLRRARRLRPVLPMSGLLEVRRLVSHVRHTGEKSVAVDDDASDLA